MSDEPTDTASTEYAERLAELQGVWWKRLLPVQAPYAWHLRSMDPGRVLDVGCGIGRSLSQLDGHGVGVDHNESAVRVCREQGLTAYTPDEFQRTVPRDEVFDSLLCAHVLEHLDPDDASALLKTYLPWLSSTAKLILITPQQRGYASDASHRTYVGLEDLASLASSLGFNVDRKRSFPFPTWAGQLFVYNENVVLASRGS